MPHVKQRAECMLFNYETTYKTSFKAVPIPALVKTEYKEKTSRISRPPAEVKDTQTLTAWKNTFPFNLLHKPKEIIRTNPYEVQQRYVSQSGLYVQLKESPEDIDRASVQQTRPRLVMTPAVSMDDVEDPRARALLCRDMYTSETTRATREAVTLRAGLAAPLPRHAAPANPIVLQKLQPPVVPPEWRMDSVSWDGKQVRGFCDPTRDFWRREKLPKCSACTESATNMDSLLNTYLTLLKMSENDPRYDLMLFNYETTMKTDFRDGAIMDIKKTLYKEKPKCLRIRPPPLKDIHTMTDWKTPYLPIDFLLKPKEVVRTDPRKVQVRYEKLEDLDKEQVRATRPRLVMVPAISMDDIEEQHKRELLIKEAYTTSAKNAMVLGIASEHKQAAQVKAPLTDKLSPVNPIAIEKWQFPYISPEWRMDSVSWDSRQLRGYCDPKRDFYLGLNTQCKVCNNTAAREYNMKMLKKMKRNTMQ
ncbi:uncharacterized protein [Epargyreus clarus]|uniref:uncharacterized protein n=1 Tax=Epargyreus clarus TaxID=520877 RepID=UPI003C2BB7B3